MNVENSHFFKKRYAEIAVHSVEVLKLILETISVKILKNVIETNFSVLKTIFQYRYER
jgi:hypothetical protein